MMREQDQKREGWTKVDPHTRRKVIENGNKVGKCKSDCAQHRMWEQKKYIYNCDEKCNRSQKDHRVKPKVHQNSKQLELK